MSSSTGSMCRSSRPARKCASGSIGWACETAARHTVSRLDCRPRDQRPLRVGARRAFERGGSVWGLPRSGAPQRGYRMRSPMIRKIALWVILLPLGALILAFAVANRQTVTLTLDPLGLADSTLTFALPLFVLAFLLVIVGVVVGGFAAWVRRARGRGGAPGRRGEEPLSGGDAGVAGAMLALLPSFLFPPPPPEVEEFRITSAAIIE